MLCSRTLRDLRAVLSGIRAEGGKAIAKRTDIGSVQEVRALVRYTLRRFGRLDVLINNAGILGPRVPMTEYPIRDWAQVLRINLSGTFYVTREVARVMVEQGSGCIINLSSSVGRAGRGAWRGYIPS